MVDQLSTWTGCLLVGFCGILPATLGPSFFFLSLLSSLLSLLTGSVITMLGVDRITPIFCAGSSFG